MSVPIAMSSCSQSMYVVKIVRVAHMTKTVLRYCSRPIDPPGTGKIGQTKASERLPSVPYLVSRCSSGRGVHFALRHWLGQMRAS